MPPDNTTDRLSADETGFPQSINEKKRIGLFYIRRPKHREALRFKIISLMNQLSFFF
jgi:hypothetical protein